MSWTYKLKRMFAYPACAGDQAAAAAASASPRVLNLYENYPFWATFFRQLGFSVLLSPRSTRKIYELGMESIPSESECYPAKLAHGHVQWLIDHGVRTIFHPCVFYEHQETPGAQNHFNCPIVVSYPENLKNNVDAIGEDGVTYLRPFLAFTDEKTAAKRLSDFCKETWGIPASETRAAVHAAWLEQQHAKADIRAQGAAALAWIEQNHGRGIVLAGRPYHVDPEINHGIPELIASYDLAVLTEDSLPIDFTPARPLRGKRPVGLSLPPLYGGGVRPHPAGARARPAQLLRLRARRRHDRPGRRNSGEEQPSLHRSEDRRGLESRRGAHPHPQPHRRHGPARPAGHPPHGRSRPL
ncbi:MAG: acyl-CoA dehydratase activase-related protein [Oscillospiraceae bacterium]